MRRTDDGVGVREGVAFGVNDDAGGEASIGNTLNFAGLATTGKRIRFLPAVGPGALGVRRSDRSHADHHRLLA